MWMGEKDQYCKSTLSGEEKLDKHLKYRYINHSVICKESTD